MDEGQEIVAASARASDSPPLPQDPARDRGYRRQGIRLSFGGFEAQTYFKTQKSPDSGPSSIRGGLSLRYSKDHLRQLIVAIEARQLLSTASTSSWPGGHFPRREGYFLVEGPDLARTLSDFDRDFRSSSCS
jgi:hypothetical protein